MMATKERIEKILEIYSINAKVLAERIGLDRPQAIYDILHGKTKSISDAMAIKIISVFPEVNKIWLLTGEGNVLNSMVLADADTEKPAEKKNIIPLYDEDQTIGGLNDMVADVNNPARVTEYVDAGDWFSGATSAIHHYGDSMIEYPSGCILALKRVVDTRLIMNGENYVIETDEFRITKQVQDDGDYIVAYSSNRDTYPDGRLIHAPIRIPKETIRHIDLVLGCVIKHFSNGPIRIK